MNQILRKIQEVLDDCVAKNTDADNRINMVVEQEKALKVREDRVAGIESAQAVLDQAKSRAQANEVAAADLVEERIKFENWMREERQALANEAARLAPVQDKEREVATAQQNLYAREEAFKVEKETYRQDIKAEIKAHFQNTK